MDIKYSTKGGGIKKIPNELIKTPTNFTKNKNKIKRINLKNDF